MQQARIDLHCGPFELLRLVLHRGWRYDDDNNNIHLHRFLNRQLNKISHAKSDSQAIFAKADIIQAHSRRSDFDADVQESNPKADDYETNHAESNAEANNATQVPSSSAKPTTLLFPSSSPANLPPVSLAAAAIGAVLEANKDDIDNKILHSQELPCNGFHPQFIASQTCWTGV